MFAKTTKTDKILFIVLVLLLGLYIISFTKSCSSTDKREVVNSALVNKKYSSKINAFQFQTENEVTLLSKKGDIWFVDSVYDSDMSLPADNQKIEKMINDLTSVQSMYKLSDKFDENNSFGLNESSSFKLRYYYDDKFNDIIFGNQDFALSSRYMMSGKSTAVYEITNMFDKYLSIASQTWTEPFIISQNILGPIKASDVQRVFVTYENNTKSVDFDDKLLDLRHGGFPSIDTFSYGMFKTPYMTIKLELGNKNEIKIDIAQSEKSDEQEFDVAVEYYDFNKKSKRRTFSKISGWTYNKIKEIML